MEWASLLLFVWAFPVSYLVGGVLREKADALADILPIRWLERRIDHPRTRKRKRGNMNLQKMEKYNKIRARKRTVRHLPQQFLFSR